MHPLRGIFVTFDPGARLPMDMIEIDCRRAHALRQLLRKRALARSAVANDHDPRSKGHDRGLPLMPRRGARR